MELARWRSVSRRSYPAFKVDWIEHWANEVEFGFEVLPHDPGTTIHVDAIRLSYRE